MVRTTTWHRFREQTVQNTSDLWNIEGFNNVGIAGVLNQGTSIRRIMLTCHFRTEIYNSGTELGVGPSVDGMQILVGIWTDMYSIGTIPPDIGASQADPGWLAYGQMTWEGPELWYHSGTLQAAFYHWRLPREFKWDIERNAGPVPIGESASVYFCWHNYSNYGTNYFTQSYPPNQFSFHNGEVFTQVLTSP